jgi:hypothetical protein
MHQHQPYGIADLILIPPNGSFYRGIAAHTHTPFFEEHFFLRGPPSLPLGHECLWATPQPRVRAPFFTEADHCVMPHLGLEIRYVLHSWGACFGSRDHYHFDHARCKIKAVTRRSPKGRP